VSGERLLLADDEDNLRSMLDAALRHSGFDVGVVVEDEVGAGEDRVGLGQPRRSWSWPATSASCAKWWPTW
jgi:hypothetical protein